MLYLEKKERMSPLSTAFLMKAQPLSNLEIMLRVLVALVIGCAIGIEREYKNRPAGLRTHVLVCIGAATIALLECLLWMPITAAPVAAEGVSLSLGRLSAQVISGIGFLGAGTIFMAQKKVAGLTTAAGLWTVACLGILAGFGYYWLAVILSILVIAVLLLLGRIIRINAVKRVEVKYVNRQQTLAFIGTCFQELSVTVIDVDFHVENIQTLDQPANMLYTNLYTLHLSGKSHYLDIVTRLSEYQDILTVRTRDA